MRMNPGVAARLRAEVDAAAPFEGIGRD